MIDERDIEKIKKIIADRKDAHSNLLSKGSNVYKSFLDLEKNAYGEGTLSKMNKELIALGISVVINCESCMEWHLKEALDAGAAENQVLEAIEVGIEMGGGPATVSSRFALKVLEYYTKAKE
ncbi:MAG: carboxymuconolactone decarboxylase family protein [Spirochaetota bacterium]|nr:MAG: carboxymuconolactone decarboxylase family protein [Spirochaetota bacterium]